MAEDRDGFDRDSNRFLEDSQRDQQRKPSNTTNTGEKIEKYWSKTTEKVPKWPLKDNGRETLSEKFYRRKFYKKNFYLNQSGKILDDFDPDFDDIWDIERLNMFCFRWLKMFNYQNKGESSNSYFDSDTWNHLN